MSSPTPRPTLQLLLTVPSVALVLLAVVPCVVLLLGAGQRAVETVANSLQEEIADRVTHYLEDYLGDAAQAAEDIAALAAADLLPHARRAEVIAYLRTRLDGGADVAGYARAGGDLCMVAAGPGGRQVVRTGDADDDGLTHLHELAADGSYGRLLDSSPLSLPDRPWFATGMAATGETWLASQPTAPGQRPQLTTVHPIVDAAGTQRGVALAAVPISAIATFLDAVDRPGQGILFIVDRESRAIVASHDDTRGRRSPAGPAAATPGPRVKRIAAQLQAKDGATASPPAPFSLDVDGVRHRVIVTPFRIDGGLDWLIVTAWPRSLFMAPLYSQARTALLLGLLVVALALLAAFLLARTIGTPLARLSAAARSSVQHDRPLQPASVPLGRGSSREIAELRDVLAMTTQRLVHEASHDHLTGLANRPRLIARLGVALEALRRDADRRFTLIFLDLDNFKFINDSLGHLVGDRVLVAIAERLRRESREGDLVARLGGDEFVLMLENLPREADAIAIAERLRKVLSEPIPLEGLEQVVVSVSGGIVHGDPACGSATELLRDADIALYRAKTEGKSRHVLFDQSMRELVMRRRQLENDLRTALEEDLLDVHYQPLVRLQNGQLTGFEALCRWEHPSLGFVPPPEFIALAKESGLVTRLDRWALRKVCEALRSWTLQIPGARDLRVSVNLSGAGLLHHDLVDYLDELTETFSLRPAQLGIELTESMLVSDLPTATEVLGALRERGCHIAIDDFGTGYSSLSYLCTLPLDALKIDKSFVDGLGTGGRHGILVNAVVALTNELGMDAVAEGIERREQYERLRACGCELGQGHLFSPPLPRREAEALAGGRVDLLQRARQ